MTDVHLKLSLDQAAAVAKALHVYSRLCLGQIQEVVELTSLVTLPLYVEAGTERRIASPEVCFQISDLVDEIRGALGYSTGSSLGIGNPHVDITGTPVYEVKKVVDQAIALHRDPNPAFRGVQYDGLTLR